MLLRHCLWIAVAVPSVLLASLTWLPVAADDHRAAPHQAYSPAGAPPLPFEQPKLGPGLTEGYHRDESLPSTSERWIDVDLSEQRVLAYEGVRPVRSFIVSTGLPRTPTVQGNFRVRLKVRSQTMSGGSEEYGYYSLPNVQWVQYFYGEYAFHGTYWHNNFGQPMSHGCVNMTNDDAKWLFDWAGPAYDWEGPLWQKPTSDNQGTLVLVHE